MAESGVPMTAPNSTPLHRGCEGPMRVSEGCYDKNQTGPEERALESHPSISCSSRDQMSQIKEKVWLYSSAGFKEGSILWLLSASGGCWHPLVYAHIIPVFAWSS